MAGNALTPRSGTLSALHSIEANDIGSSHVFSSKHISALPQELDYGV